MNTIDLILEHFEISPKDAKISTFGAGLIHVTYLIENSTEKYILQKVNTYVFQKPEVISQNLKLASEFLKKHHPTYIFPGLITSKNQDGIFQNSEGHWKLSPFISNTYTINKPTNPQMAYEAAKTFAKLTKNLDGLPLDNIHETIPNFHNLDFRNKQFQEALKNGMPERIHESNLLITKALKYSHLVDTYNSIVSNKAYPQRMIHHDTKINNVLFDKNTHKSIAVCDLDTLMPGRIISDIGDMVRTYACSENENHINPEEVHVLKEYLEALHAGYLNTLGGILTKAEIKYIDFAGPFMIYMQAIRFLGDYLIGDKYYGAAYPRHNYDRAANQLALLESLDNV
jgi:thiamine kinase-like enzyme